MGSTFTTLPPEHDQTSITGHKKKLPAYVQFVPGITVKIATGMDSIDAQGVESKVGSIIAMPHFGEKGVSKPSLAGEGFRYYPLLRGIQEVPTPGDPVLLCTFGGVQYYLGPLNTEGSPNFNNDALRNTGVNPKFNETILSEGSLETPLFKKENYIRLQKLLNPILDSPWVPVNKDENSFMGAKQFISDTICGDLIFEGRHGNSIRIGSRNVDPYIFISNGRSENRAVESTLDGTIIAILENGSIRDHFNMDYKIDGVKSKKYPFQLADDETDTYGTKAHRSISKTFTTALGRGLGRNKKYSNPDAEYTGEDDEDITKTLYDFNKNQLFASSGRITFNARDDSMFLSSNNFIHLGACDNITLSTGKTFLIDAAESVIIKTNLFKVEAAGEVYIDSRKTITLGSPEKPLGGGGDVVHPAVLGNGLVTYLALIINEIQSLALATASAIEGRHTTGASNGTMDVVVQDLNLLLGELTEETNFLPANMVDIILSTKVFLK